MIYLLAPAITQRGYSPSSALSRNISEKVSHGFPCVRISCGCLRPATAWVRRDPGSMLSALTPCPRKCDQGERRVMRLVPPISVQQWTRALSRWDVLAVLLVLGILIFFAEASRNLLQPMAELRMTPLSLEPTHLPEYAARTTLRMLLALSLSLIFTFTYATLAAKSKRAEVLLVPLLDILQSVPILGFVSVTIVFFM